MAYESVEDANQQTLETLTELERRARELVNILKGGIDVGQSGTLGNLALLDTLSASPVGNAETLRSNMGLANGATTTVGTAATRDVGEASDNVLGVGAFGLGVQNPPLTVDFDTLTTPGFYAAGSGSPNRPFNLSSGFVILVKAYQGNRVVQEADSLGDRTRYLRVGVDGSWGPWQQVITSNIALGHDQVWYDYTGARNPTTTYVNTLDRPIMVMVTADGTAGTAAVCSVYVSRGSGSVRLANQITIGAGNGGYIGSTFIVPPGYSYSVTLGTEDEIFLWAELR